MIHVFNCCKDTCAKCDCEVICAPCEDFCGNCADLLQRPLGGYVVMAVWLSSLEITACALSLAKKKILDGCTIEDNFGGQVGIEYWLIVQIVFAAIHFLFAPYIQCMLMKQLNESALQDGGRRDTLSKQKVKDSFIHVFLHDFGVLFYVIILFGSYVWSWMGSDWSRGNANCNPGQWPSWAAALGLFFPWFVIFYALGWWCLIGCMASGEEMVLRGRGTQYHDPESAQRRRVQSQPWDARDDPDDRCEAPGVRRGVQSKQMVKLVACIGLDLMGNATYFLPALGEAGDLAFAPAQAVALKAMFDANGLALLGLAEELVPFTDFIPTATIGWCLETFLPDSPLSRMLGIRG